MIKVDVVKLGNTVGTYSSIISNLYDTDAKISQGLNAFKYSWNDQKCQTMLGVANLERGKINRLNSDMKNELSIYKYAYEKYKKLGRSVKYNDGNSDYIIHKLDVVSDQLEFVIEQFGQRCLGNLNWVDTNTLRIIHAQRDRLIMIRNAFDNAREIVTDNMNYIEGVESSIADMSKNVKIESFARNYYEKKA